MSALHFHNCPCCGDRFECDGDWEKNHDGFPEVICSTFHVAGLNGCAKCVAGHCSKCGDCLTCRGSGEVELVAYVNAPTEAEGGMHEQTTHEQCPDCKGTGRPAEA